VLSQIWIPLSRLNRRTDGAAGQILRLQLVLNRPVGVAGCTLRQQHPAVVSRCDWLLCVKQSNLTLSLVTSDGRSSSGLFKHVVNRVDEFYDKDKLVRQTYDGACVMSGRINGLQSKVIEAYPLAIFKHCYAHVLNLVLKQRLSNIKECRLFFQAIS
jgi:hypothetical protein